MAINSKENQECWNCDHFQLYDDSSTPTKPWGECRWTPVKGYLYNNDWFDRYIPFVYDARTFWCSKWKKTNLTPPPKPTGSIPQLNWPDVFWNWVIWSKVPENKTCWHCNHFQRDDEVPTDSWGQCRKNPPLPVLDEYIGLSPTGDTIYGEPIPYYGLICWCSCWEETETPNPEI